MRVYELAKQLGMENRELIPELKRMGVAVTSHSSALDDDVVQKALAKLSSKAKAPAKATGKATAGGKGAAHAAPVVEDAKADKRRILIKRKRDDEAPAEEPASLPAAETAETSGAAVDALHVSPPSAHPEVEAQRAPHPELTVMTAPEPFVGTATVPPSLTAAKPAIAPSIDLTAGKRKRSPLKRFKPRV